MTNVALDVGYLKTSYGSIRLLAYNGTDRSSPGRSPTGSRYERYVLSAPGITRFPVEPIGEEDAGFAIDNVEYSSGSPPTDPR